MPHSGMDTKHCPGCKADKPITEFYGHATYGAQSICKECSKATQSKWAKANRKRKNSINKAWRDRHPDRRAEMIKATNALWRAIRAGDVMRGTLCERCGSANRIEAAHDDYSQPLNVKWLCIKCHRVWDAQSPKTKSQLNITDIM